MIEALKTKLKFLKSIENKQLKIKKSIFIISLKILLNDTFKSKYTRIEISKKYFRYDLKNVLT